MTDKIENETESQPQPKSEPVRPARDPSDMPRAYLLLRGDLPSLGNGKGRAHAMHAGNAMTWKLVVEPLMGGIAPDPDVMDWHREGEGFGTTISLGGPEEVTGRVLDGIVLTAKACGHHADKVVDKTYPYFVDAEVMPLISQDLHTAAPARVKGGWICHRKEVTGAWLFGTRDQLDTLLARFGLTPDR